MQLWSPIPCPGTQPSLGKARVLGCFTQNQVKQGGSSCCTKEGRRCGSVGIRASPGSRHTVPQKWLLSLFLDAVLVSHGHWQPDHSFTHSSPFQCYFGCDPREWSPGKKSGCHLRPSGCSLISQSRGRKTLSPKSRGDGQVDKLAPRLFSLPF